MKNLADFKRKATKGSILHCIYHLQFDHRTTAGEVVYRDEVRPPREISIVQSNAIALKTVKSTGEVVDSWFHWPKAAECEFTHDGKCIVFEQQHDRERGKTNMVKCLTYWIEDVSNTPAYREALQSLNDRQQEGKVFYNISHEDVLRKMETMQIA